MILIKCFLSVFFVITFLVNNLNGANIVNSALIELDEIKLDVNDPIVCILDGCILGKKMLSYKGRDFTGFVGVPFAKPPVGNLRFANPVPADSWTTTLNATIHKPDCMQKNYLIPNPSVDGSEDCLYLNVYRPNKNLTNLPVMVYVHGGGYFSGSSSPTLHGPQYFMDTEEVILVTTSYRLGVFGFLSTGDESSPGNFAFKDQALALGWVKKNIKKFGGNPNSVTLFGQSAGAASVHMHTMSPLSKGLFHRVIIQSGNAIAPYNYVTKNPLKLARKQAKYSGIRRSKAMSTSELISALRGVDAELLVQAGDKFKFWSVDPLTVYRPVVEENRTGAFLIKDPIDLQKSGLVNFVPTLMGFVQNEGVVRAAAIIANATLLSEINLRYKEIIPLLMEFAPRHPKESDKKRIERNLKKVTDYYFNGTEAITEENGQRFIDLYSDRAFLHPLFQTIQQFVEYSTTPLYLYRFAFKGSLSYSLVFTGTTKDFGVVHCDDLLYLFRSPDIFPNEFPKDSVEAKMIEKFVGTFVSFAKTGKPIQWANVNECKKNQNSNVTMCDYQDIRKSDDSLDVSVTVNNSFDMNMIKLWDEIE